MRNINEVEELLSKVEFDMDHTQNYDNYKYLEGVYNTLKWILEESTEEICPECDVELVENGLPPDDSNNIRLMCPQCGRWKWLGDEEFDY